MFAHVQVYGTMMSHHSPSLDVSSCHGSRLSLRGEGQEGFPLDLAAECQHVSLESAGVPEHVLRHHLRPQSVVPAIGDQREDNLEAVK